jgi:hypothetical protein
MLNDRDKSPVFLTVAVHSLPFHNLPLNTYTSLNLENLKQLEPGFSLIETIPATLANNPAHSMVLWEELAIPSSAA